MSWRYRLDRISGLVVREYLVETQDDVCKQERTFDRISFPTADPPNAEENGAGDCYANKSSIDVTDLRKTSDPPEEVNRARDDRGRHDEQADLHEICQLIRDTYGKTYHPAVASSTPIDKPSGDLASSLNDQEAAEPLA